LPEKTGVFPAKTPPLSQRQIEIIGF